MPIVFMGRWSAQTCTRCAFTKEVLTSIRLGWLVGSLCVGRRALSVLGCDIRNRAASQSTHYFGTPNRFVNEPQFGTITDAATPDRELQIAARLSY